MPTIAAFLGSYFLCHTSLNYLNRVKVEKRFKKNKIFEKHRIMNLLLKHESFSTALFFGFCQNA